jgi:hypothetical protein
VQERIEAVPMLGRHDDQVGVVIRGGRGDPVRGSAESDVVVRGDAGALQLLDLGFEDAQVIGVGNDGRPVIDHIPHIHDARS